MVDGQLADLYGEPVQGSRVVSLGSAIAEDNPTLQGVLESLEFDQNEQGFSALNTATLNPGLVIYVDRNVDAGEWLVQWHESREQKDLLVNSRVVVVLEEGAELQLVEQFENGPESTSLLNVVMQFSLAQNSAMTHTRVQQQSSSSVLITRTDVSQSGNSRFHFTGLDLGEGLARHDVKASLLGTGASCALNGACMTRGKSHVDHHLEAAHTAADCQSSQLFRAVANDQSRVVFNGKVHVFEGADGTDATQSSAGLLLSKLAEIDAKPELEIYADEVIASHGATVGQLDDEALFYLRSRGIGNNEARNLLTMAFCRSVTDQLSVAALREPLGERLTRSLQANGVAGA
jgi:Fe-S cluster assembly protein SufD